MARVFNIYFVYQGSMHNAVVSVRATPFFTEFTLHNFNEDLLRLLPGNKIIFRSPDHYIFQNASPAHSADLMNSIIKAVSEHLHAATQRSEKI